MNQHPLPYGDEITNAKTDKINEAYIDVIDNYIGTQVVVKGKDYIRVLEM